MESEFYEGHCAWCDDDGSRGISREVHDLTVLGHYTAGPRPAPEPPYTAQDRADLAAWLAECAHCKHPAHAAGECAAPENNPLDLYGFCQCEADDGRYDGEESAYNAELLRGYALDRRG